MQTDIILTLAEIEALLRAPKKRGQAEQNFIGRIKSWTERGARFSFTATFSEYNGHTITASFGVASTLVCRTVFMAWTLRIPYTATKESRFRRSTSLRFFGRAEGHAKDACDEQLCAIAASGTFESNERYPREGRGKDGFALAPTLPATPSESSDPAIPMSEGEQAIVEAVNTAARAHQLPGTAATLKEAVQLCVNRGILEIKEDIRAGKLPQGISNFGDLHDFVDANEYGLLCDDASHNDEKVGAFPLFEFANAVQDAIGAWLKETAEYRRGCLTAAEAGCTK